MGLEMIDRDEGEIMHRGNRLGGHHADMNAADQAGPAVGRDPIEIGKAEPRCLQGARDQPVEMFEMGARGDLGHHAAIGPMGLELVEG